MADRKELEQKCAVVVARVRAAAGPMSLDQILSELPEKRTDDVYAGVRIATETGQLEFDSEMKLRLRAQVRRPPSGSPRRHKPSSTTTRLLQTLHDLPQSAAAECRLAGADIPNAAAIARCDGILRALADLLLPPDRLSWSIEGGVGCVFYIAGGLLTLEAFNSGEVVIGRSVLREVRTWDCTSRTAAEVAEAVKAALAHQEIPDARP